MLIHRFFSCALLLALFAVTPHLVSAQRQASVIDTARARARAPYETGLAQLRAEAYDAALKSFQQAIDLDATFDLAYYMLGRTHMALRNYVAATVALSKCRDLYQADSTRQFTTKSERQQVLRDHIRDVEQLIDETKKAADDPRNANYRFTYLENIRQYEERKRQLQDQERNDSLQGTNPVPAYVSLALGSAYFRSGKMQDAEQAYLATVAADPKVGEAHNNLAVVYMETGRFDQAEKAVKAAEKSGLKVQKALKDEIEKRKKAGS
jgi:tetratricopeptide (TPR) repeat protein